MKIARILVMAMAVALIGLCAGCGVKPQPLTPQQIATIACPQLDLVHTQIAAFNAVLKADPAMVDLDSKAHDALVKVCKGASAAPSVDASSIHALVQTGLPAFAYLAGLLPLPPAQQAQIQDALVIAETAAGVVGVVEAQIKAAQAVPASAASAAKP